MSAVTKCFLGFLALVSLSIAARAADDEGTVLVVKTTEPTGRQLRELTGRAWGGTEIGNGSRFVVRAFPGPMRWKAASHFPADRYFLVGLKPGVAVEDAMRTIGQMSTVESVQPDYELSDPDFALPTDPRVKDEWYLKNLKVTDAWNLTRGENVWVADVESGWDTHHPDLVHQFDLPRCHDYDPAAVDADRVDGNKRSHGTPVAGIIAAEAGNGLFGAGIAFNAKLIGSQMAANYETHSREELWTVNVAKAILGSIERGASVILIEKQVPSLSSSIERVKVIYDAIRAAVDAGIPVVVPAGNFSQDLQIEASQPDSGAIFAGAATQDEHVADFSDYGARVNVSAPGENVYSTQEDGQEIFDFSGTSSASAITAGVTALVKAANPRLTPRQIRQILIETGKPLHPDPRVFAGLLPGLAGPVLAMSAHAVGPLVQAGPAVVRAQHFTP